MSVKQSAFRKLRVFGGVSAIALGVTLGVALSSPASAQTTTFDIPAQPLSDAIADFSRQSNVNVLVASSLTEGRISSMVSGEMSPEDALAQLIGNASLEIKPQADGSLVLANASGSGAALSRDGRTRVAQADITTDVSDRSAEEESERKHQKPDEMIVTGTNIRGIAPDSTPTLSFDQEDIRATGLPTLNQFLRTIPQNFGGGNQEENRGPGTNGGGDRGGAAVNLRGFGNGRTLSLLNGQRIAAEQGGFGPAVDISIIPIAAVKNVEIVTAGASSIYGSDAVGGVVNFVLRTDFEGAETTLSGGTLTDGDGTTLNASQLLGGFWNSGNAMIVYDYFSQDSLLAGDREFTDPAISTNELTPNLSRHSVLASFRQNVGSDVELFSDLYASTSDVSRDVNISFQSLFLNEATDRTSYGGTVGLRYDISETWQVEAYATYSRNESTFEQTNLNTGLLASSSPAIRESSSTIFGAKADGSLFSIPGGEVKVAIGGEGRFEKNAAITPTLDRTLKSDVASAFGEIYVPLVGSRNALPGVQRLELTASARHESFEGGLSSTDPQVGLVWAPTRDLKFRGNWGTSFRTPTLAQQNPTPIRALVFGFFIVPDQVSTTPATLFLQGTDPDLEPEQSQFWTVGVDYSPSLIPGLTMSLTYYNIDLTDEIGVPPFSINLGDPLAANFVTLQPSRSQILDALAVFSSTTPTELDAVLAGQGLVFDDIEAIYSLGTKNIAQRVTRGFDVTIDYRFDTNVGEFGINTNASYIKDYDITPFAGAPSTSILDTLNEPVSWRLNGGLSWVRGGLTANVFVRYVDDYENILNTPISKIGSYLTVDVNASYSFGQGVISALAGTQISLAINNLFDEDPPLVGDNDGSNSFPGSGTGYDPVNASALGRSINLTLTKKW